MPYIDLHASSLVPYSKSTVTSRMISLSSSSHSSSSTDPYGSSVLLQLSFSLVSWLVASEMAGQASVNQCASMMHASTAGVSWEKLNMATNRGQHLFHWCRVSVWHLYEGSVYSRAAFNTVYCENHCLPTIYTMLVVYTTGQLYPWIQAWGSKVQAT